MNKKLQLSQTTASYYYDADLSQPTAKYYDWIPESNDRSVHRDSFLVCRSFDGLGQLLQMYLMRQKLFKQNFKKKIY